MRQPHRARDQQGALSIEFLVVISALMVVFLLMLQYAVNAHAQAVAQAAAEDALQAAQGYGATTTDGRHAGQHTLADLGDLADTDVTVTRTATTADVTVTGDAPQVIPFLPRRIVVHIEGPVERFVNSP